MSSIDSCADAGPAARAVLRGAMARIGLVACVISAGCATPRPAPAPAPALPPPATRAAVPAAAPDAPVAAGPAARARNWTDYRVQAATRIVQANPGMTYMGVVPEPLLAIPVLEVELNANGSVRAIDVMRQPSQARETTQMAIDAVRRAAPFPSVAHLPKPWKFAEAFLFDDNKRFKPRSLDVR